MQEVGDTSGFVSYRPVSGGSIARSFQVTTHNERYFVKCVKGLPSDLFEKEADGLKRLGKAGAFSVPKVYGHARESAARPAWLVLEWIEPGVETDGGERFGVTLAQQHRITAERYGLDTDNYIGSMVQKNGWFEDWVQFLPRTPSSSAGGLGAKERADDRLATKTNGTASRPFASLVASASAQFAFAR